MICANDEASPPNMDVMQASLFYLMNRYTVQPSVTIAAAVVDQLTSLAAHPEIVLLPVQQKLYARLLNEWRARASTIAQSCATARLH